MIDSVAVPTQVDCFFVENVLGANQSTTGISFFPNPAHDQIAFNQAVSDVKIFSVDGKNVEVELNRQKVTFPPLNSGLYMVLVTTLDHQKHVLRLVHL
jgi:hypothetical protein